MKYFFGIICLVCATAALAQPLRDINYQYLYNPVETFTLDLKPVRHADSWTILYRLQLRDTSVNIDDYTIQWESRQTLADKEATALAATIGVKETHRHKQEYGGELNIAAASAPNILVARVVHNSIKRAWIFYKPLEPKYPVDLYLKVNHEALTRPFINITDRVTLETPEPKVVSYYNDNFPAALPPFAEAQGRVSKGMKTDSTFSITSGVPLNFSATGLYLLQKDTNATEGFAIRAEADYPRLARIPSLAGPLIYICTKSEYDQLVLAKNEKKIFDRIILGVTNDTDRARKLIRNYFRRVELANQYFTSYKEGWKTDRGMIFIVFGVPDEVYKFSDREVWTYKNDLYKATFNFARSSSLFDPENYVLIREKKYQQTWYEVIDLWRSARF
jgi:GWxTD domain-containing protein